MKRYRVICIGVLLLLLALAGVGCSSSVESLRVEQPTLSSVVIVSAGNSWDEDYSVAYQIVLQLDKKVGVECFSSVTSGRQLRTTVVLSSPAVVSIRKYATDGDSRISDVEVVVVALEPTR